jgi:hypothetical protein
MPLYRATAADLPAVVDLVNSAYRGETSRQGWTTEADYLEGQRTDLATLSHDLTETPGAALYVWRDDPETPLLGGGLARAGGDRRHVPGHAHGAP